MEYRVVIRRSKRNTNALATYSAMRTYDVRTKATVRIYAQKIIIERSRRNQTDDINHWQDLICAEVLHHVLVKLDLLEASSKIDSSGLHDFYEHTEYSNTGVNMERLKVLELNTQARLSLSTLKEGLVR